MQIQIAYLSQKLYASEVGTNDSSWIIITVNGEHVGLGRNSDPSVDEVAAAEFALVKAGSAGWLAVMRGKYYTSKIVEIMKVRELASPRASWEYALASFNTRRAAVLNHGLKHKTPLV
ncbi:MAG: hypothetical protein PHT60_10800 [Acidiphilium sp.]|nr:hypothetical protein [Acidiphilium sp.]MDD4936249.1 hypothetical protein [Acidiphilium sp.]